MLFRFLAAAGQTQPCILPPYWSSNVIKLADNVITCTQVQQLLNQTATLDRILPQSLSRNEQQSFKVYYKNSRPTANVHVSLVYRALSKTGAELNENSMLPVNIHEYAHSILTRFLTSKLEPYRTYYTRKRDFEELLEKMKAIEKIKETPQPRAEFDRLDAKWEEYRVVAYDLEQKLLNDKIISLVLPFHEFFADLAAVIALDDGKAIHNFLQLAYQTIGKTERDFTADVPIKGWNSKAKHTGLDPSRSWIWKETANLRPYSIETKKKILEAAANAIETVVAEGWQNEIDFTTEYHNTRLVEELSKQLTTQKLYGPNRIQSASTKKNAPTSQ